MVRLTDVDPVAMPGRARTRTTAHETDVRPLLSPASARDRRIVTVTAVDPAATAATDRTRTSVTEAVVLPIAEAARALTRATAAVTVVRPVEVAARALTRTIDAPTVVLPVAEADRARRRATVQETVVVPVAEAETASSGFVGERETAETAHASATPTAAHADAVDPCATDPVVSSIATEPSAPDADPRVVAGAAAVGVAFVVAIPLSTHEWPVPVVGLADGVPPVPVAPALASASDTWSTPEYDVAAPIAVVRPLRVTLTVFAPVAGAARIQTSERVTPVASDLTLASATPLYVTEETVPDASKATATTRARFVSVPHVCVHESDDTDAPYAD